MDLASWPSIAQQKGTQLMPTKDLQKKAKELNEPLPGSMLPTKDLQEKAKELKESLPGSWLHPLGTSPEVVYI